MQSRKESIVEKAHGQLEQWKEWRRTLHRFPELSFQEYGTARFVAEKLKSFGNIQVETGIGKTGVVGTLSGGEGPTIALRADMDALPIAEMNEHGFQPQHEGVMHACGHDAHTTMLLGAASILSRISKSGNFNGTIKFIFQPAEESPDENGLSGAPHMIREGVLEDVDASIALHVCPWHPVGHIQMNDGYSMANVDVFEGKITGSGGHGGYPDKGTDPVWMLGSVLQAFYSIPSRRISPLDTAVASIGEIHAGSADNIIPQEVAIKGTLRTYDPSVRERLGEEVEKAFRVTRSLGGDYSFSVQRGEPALQNDPSINQLIRRSAGWLYPGLNIHTGPFGLGGEDFGYMTRHVPGAMFFLGCMMPDGIMRDLHTPSFDIDENCMPIGISILVATALQFLERTADGEA